MKFTFPPESTPLAGYTIKRGIHRGGFGEVYYAHTDAGKEVALKLLQSQLEVELRGVRQCLNLKHPNLVGLYDIRVDDDGDHWIVMEYVSGRCLSDVFEDHPDGLPVDDVVTWIDGMAAGLDFLHDRGIVHRDLKPGNVFVEHGLVKIGDVGLSKYISQSRRNEQTQSVGTVYYMAPEVAHGRYGHEVDVYSLGVVLYELLTGRVPFDGESTGEILMKHLTEEPDLTAVDPRFRPVIAQALAKDPAERTATVGDVATAFRSAVGARQPALVGAGAAGGSTPYAPPVPAFEEPPSATVPPAPAGPESNHPNDPAGESTTRSSWAELTWLERTNGMIRSVAGWLWERPWAAVTAIVLLIAVPHVVIPLSLASAAAWLGWRTFVTPGPVPVVRHRPREPEPTAGRTAGPVLPRPVKSSELLSPETERRIGFRRRVAELSGSLAYAAPLTGLVTLVLYLASPTLPMPRHAYGSGVDASAIGLFASVTLIASWAVLALGKFGEGRRINGLHRRIVYLLVGGFVGVLAFAIHETLLAELSGNFFRGRDHLVNRLPDRPLLDSYGQPTLHGYVIFFALLFALRRWWWHVDGFRPWRFRVWTVGVTGFVGFLLCSVFAFPHLWGALWAASIATVTQLAAAWMPPGERHTLEVEGTGVLQTD